MFLVIWILKLVHFKILDQFSILFSQYVDLIILIKFY